MEGDAGGGAGGGAGGEEMKGEEILGGGEGSIVEQGPAFEGPFHTLVGDEGIRGGGQQQHGGQHGGQHGRPPLPAGVCDCWG